MTLVQLFHTGMVLVWQTLSTPTEDTAGSGAPSTAASLGAASTTALGVSSKSLALRGVDPAGSIGFKPGSGPGFSTCYIQVDIWNGFGGSKYLLTRYLDRTQGPPTCSVHARRGACFEEGGVFRSSWTEVTVRPTMFHHLWLSKQLPGSVRIDAKLSIQSGQVRHQFCT